MTRCMGCMREYFGDVQVCPHCAYEQGTPAREAYHLMPESVLEGRYILGKVLGFGGFGVTYIGWDAQLERIVAIKEFLPTNFATRMPGGTAVTVYEGGATEQFGFGLHRFVEEAQRLAQFNGIKGITDIYDTFSGNNTAYIVMEYLKGRDVKVLLATEGALPYERARDIVIKVCDTLMPVHQKGIIHRDISPDNIYLTDDGEVKLLDFGAARYESSVNSKSLSVILKSGYAPEEQYRSRGEQGPWTDVYALAATFYKMLTGATPPDSMERAVRDEIKEPSKLGAQLPKSAENTILNALNIKKADRTKSVEEFKAELQAGEVERVKVKKRHTKSGKVPVPAIVGMALAGALLVAFIALDAAGVVEIGGEVAAPDNFGAAVETGMIVVPNIENLTESEAKQKLEELGLSMEIGVPYISGTVDEEKVVLQEPVAGKQLAKGEIVNVRVSAGNWKQGMDSGVLPNLAGMTAMQSSGYCSELYKYGFTNLNVEYLYEYSTDVPAGIVTRLEEQMEGGWNSCIIYISAGADDAATPMGELRAPFLYLHHSFGFEAALASSLETENEYREITLEYSYNGAEWKGFIGLNKPQFEGGSMERQDKSVPSFKFWLSAPLVGEGRTQFRLAIKNNSEEDPINVIMMDQVLVTQYEGEPLQIDNHEWLTGKEIKDLFNSGEYTEEELTDEVLECVKSEEEYYMERNFLRLKGDFTTKTFHTSKSKGEYYTNTYYIVGSRLIELEYVNSGRIEENKTVRCTKDGELIVALPYGKLPSRELTINYIDDEGISEDGMVITSTRRPPVTFTVPAQAE